MRDQLLKELYLVLVGHFMLKLWPLVMQLLQLCFFESIWIDPQIGDYSKRLVALLAIADEPNSFPEIDDSRPAICIVSLVIHRLSISVVHQQLRVVMSIISADSRNMVPNWVLALFLWADADSRINHIVFVILID